MIVVSNGINRHNTTNFNERAPKQIKNGKSTVRLVSNCSSFNLFLLCYHLATHIKNPESATILTASTVVLNFSSFNFKLSNFLSSSFVWAGSLLEKSLTQSLEGL